MRWMVDRRLVYNFDGFLFLTSLAIVSIGTVPVYSATFDPSHPTNHPYAWRQAMWGVAGIAAALFMVMFDYRKLER